MSSTSSEVVHNYTKFFGDIAHLAETTEWDHDGVDAELFYESGGMYYNLLFWFRHEGGVWCDFIYSVADDAGSDPWQGETVTAPTVIEAFNKSLEVNSYLLRGYRNVP